MRLILVLAFLIGGSAYAAQECDIRAQVTDQIGYTVYVGAKKSSDTYFYLQSALDDEYNKINQGECAWPASLKECDVKAEISAGQLTYVVERGSEQFSYHFVDVQNAIAERVGLVNNRICAFPKTLKKCEVVSDSGRFTVYRGDEKMSDTYLNDADAEATLKLLRRSAVCN